MGALSINVSWIVIREPAGLTAPAEIFVMPAEEKIRLVQFPHCKTETTKVTGRKRLNMGVKIICATLKSRGNVPLLLKNLGLAEGESTIR